MSEMSDVRGGGPGKVMKNSDRPIGRGGKWYNRGRGGKTNAASSAGGREGTTIPVKLRPTHFLALPLNNYPSLMAQIQAFHKGLFSNADGFDEHLNSQSTSRQRRALGKGSKVTTVKSSLIEGLDDSILIDPRRLHMTLGVMALEQDDGSVEMSPTSLVDYTATSLPTTPPPTTPSTKKTVSTAISLLNSLKPRISEILDGDKGVGIPLEVMHVLKTEKMWMNVKKGRRAGDMKEGVSRGGERNGLGEGAGRNDPALLHNDDVAEKDVIGAGVLYVAPEIKNETMNTNLRKLIQVSELVHQAFKDAGYLTDTRPLKLHCTILNTSHRKPHFRQPFSYSDIIASDALRLLRGNSAMSVQERNSSGSIQHSVSTSARQPNISSSSNPSSKAIKPQGHSVLKNPPSVSVNLGVCAVGEIQLWVMGSHGPNNEYVSCGGVLLE